MLVVADSSPINILVRVGCVDVLHELFGRVLVPPHLDFRIDPGLVQAALLRDAGRRPSTARGPEPPPSGTAPAE